MKLLALIALLPTLAQCLDARNNGKGNDKGNQGNGNGNGGSTQKRPNFICAFPKRLPGKVMFDAALHRHSGR